MSIVPPARGVLTIAAATLLGMGLSACGGSSGRKASSATTPPSTPAPAGEVVVQVGKIPITGAIYDHWITIGDATVEMPVPGHPLPTPVTYEPPDFTTCVAHLRAGAPRSSPAQLEARCKRTYDGIQARVLNFLITGYWLREEATAEGVSVSRAEVEKQFETVKRTQYPTAASFHRLLEASRQTTGDLMFAVETQMLSTLLLEKFTKVHGKDRSEPATIAAFNRTLRSKWEARTDCQPGYMVKDCRQRP